MRFGKQLKISYTVGMFSIVVAMAHGNVIGAKNRIPWRIRADLVRLKQLTKDQVVVLGKHSYESMAWYYNKSGKPMPGKLYIVVTREQNYHPEKEKTVVAHSIDEALRVAREHTEGDVFIIGGAQIYEQTLAAVNRLYVTEVDADIDGDAYFPTLPKSEWREVARELHKADEKNEFDYSFVTLERV